MSAYSAATSVSGPPRSDVPVSMAANEDEPEGSDTDAEFTLRLLRGRDQYEGELESTD